MSVYPITFSIAESKIVEKPLEKTRYVSSLIPGVLSTYIYNSEEEYYTQYKESYFAITTKKGGWDCMRHYEILACGCIPFFPDIENSPANTMALLPKHMIEEGNFLYRNYIDKAIDVEFKEKWSDLSSRLLSYTRNTLTTKKMAQYILCMSKHSNVKKILFLSGYIEPDYLRCVTLQGFKALLGSSCHDYPKINHIYRDAGIEYSSKYGKGFTYTNLVEQSLHDTKLDSSIEEDIKSHVYDIVIYGSYHRGMPFYDIVIGAYKPEEIILLCGEENHCCTYETYTRRGHIVFVREF